MIYPATIEISNATMTMSQGTNKLPPLLLVLRMSCTRGEAREAMSLEAGEILRVEANEVDEGVTNDGHGAGSNRRAMHDLRHKARTMSSGGVGVGVNSDLVAGARGEPPSASCVRRLHGHLRPQDAEQ